MSTISFSSNYAKHDHRCICLCFAREDHHFIFTEVCKVRSANSLPPRFAREAHHSIFHRLNRNTTTASFLRGHLEEWHRLICAKVQQTCQSFISPGVCQTRPPFKYFRPVSFPPSYAKQPPASATTPPPGQPRHEPPSASVKLKRTVPSPPPP